ncbi:hypothetical protein [Shewanella insulae]|uniref:hypothetical protein n=1 Tax=Shewanella insulae TaxID=2681496 RepID=UPI00247FCB99|nr:hypothetical protein [Shewanella insulae]
MQSNGPKHGDIILIDANVIIEADKLKTWKAIAGAYNLHTVETVVKEALRKPAQGQGISMTEASLRGSFSTIHTVSEDESADWILSYPELLDSAIDDGERDLLTYFHCCGDKKIWFLCGPDVGAMKGLHGMGLLDRLVSLEQLQKNCGIKNKIQNHFNQKWHDTTVYEIKSNLR